MRVLFLANIPSPYRVDFFEELGKLCDLTVLYELTNATDRDEKWKAKKATNFNEVFLNGIKIGADSALCFSVIKYITDKRYDIIVVGGYSTPTGMLAVNYLKLTKRSFILNIDGGIISNESFIKFLIKKYFISSPSAWLSTGKESNKYLEHYGAMNSRIYEYPFTSLKENDILKNTILDNEKIEYRKKLNMIEKNIIISVGRFIYSKGYDVLLESCKELSKDIGIYIIGGKPTSEYLMMKQKFGLQNVHFVDFKTKEEIKDYYKAADLFVLPTRGDVWGLVINEAMSYGLPVITTDKCVAGLELIDKEYVVRSERISELSNCINRVINNKDEINKISIKNLEKIKRYTIENMSKTHINIFEDVLGMKR